MPQVTFEDQRKAADFPAGKTLLSCALEMGIVISHVCGGDGACGTCRVEVLGTCWDLLTPPTPDDPHRSWQPAGGRDAGVMAAAVRGAKRVGRSLTVGILPTESSAHGPPRAQ